MEQERKSTQELMNDLMNRIELKLEDGEIKCPTCKGLRFTYKQYKNEEYGHINQCRDCHNGKNYICKHCGKNNMSDHCDCKDAEKEREDKYKDNKQKEQSELFDKTKKIKFKDYKGVFILEDDDFVQGVDNVYDWLYDIIKFKNIKYEDLPKYLWTTQPETVFDLDLYDIISDKCEDGYEDMYSYLDTEDKDLAKAQKYLDKWYKKQGNSVCTYYKDYTVAVLLDDLIKEVREDIEKEVN